MIVDAILCAIIVNPAAMTHTIKNPSTAFSPGPTGHLAIIVLVLDDLDTANVTVKRRVAGEFRVTDVPKAVKRLSNHALQDVRDASVLGDLATFIEANAGWMMGVALRILLDKGHADDALQSAPSKILEAANDFEGRGSFKVWMHRVIISEAPMPAPQDQTPQRVGQRHVATAL